MRRDTDMMGYSDFWCLNYIVFVNARKCFILGPAIQQIVPFFLLFCRLSRNRLNVKSTADQRSIIEIAVRLFFYGWMRGNISNPLILFTCSFEKTGLPQKCGAKKMVESLSGRRGQETPFEPERLFDRNQPADPRHYPSMLFDRVFACP